MATRKKKIETNNESVLTHQHEGPLAIGIDLGDRLSHYCILTGEGDVLLEGRLQVLQQHFVLSSHPFRPH